MSPTLTLAAPTVCQQYILEQVRETPAGPQVRRMEPYPDPKGDRIMEATPARALERIEAGWDGNGKLLPAAQRNITNGRMRYLEPGDVVWMGRATIAESAPKNAYVYAPGCGNDHTMSAPGRDWVSLNRDQYQAYRSVPPAHVTGKNLRATLTGIIPQSAPAAAVARGGKPTNDGLMLTPRPSRRAQPPRAHAP